MLESVDNVERVYLKQNLPSFNLFTSASGEYDLFDRIRGQDIRLLKTLKVKYICDLMVEKKKVKFGMRWEFVVTMSVHCEDH